MAAIGGADVTINDSEINLSSVTRCAVHVGGTGTVTVNNTKMYNVSPKVEMGNWSWGIAIRGTNRLCQLADDGTVHYNGCTMRSNGWGILSVDGSNYAHMFVENCDMELEGAGSHGYGVFCIGPTICTSGTPSSPPTASRCCSVAWSGREFWRSPMDARSADVGMHSMRRAIRAAW